MPEHLRCRWNTFRWRNISLHCHDNFFRLPTSFRTAAWWSAATHLLNRFYLRSLLLLSGPVPVKSTEEEMTFYLKRTFFNFPIRGKFMATVLLCCALLSSQEPHNRYLICLPKHFWSHHKSQHIPRRLQPSIIYLIFCCAFAHFDSYFKLSVKSTQRIENFVTFPQWLCCEWLLFINIFQCHSFTRSLISPRHRRSIWENALLRMPSSDVGPKMCIGKRNISVVCFEKHNLM